MSKVKKPVDVIKDNATMNGGNSAAVEGNAANAAPAKLSAVELVSLSAEWIKQYGTISAIRADYAALVEKYGKENYSAVLSKAQGIRAEEIKNAQNALNEDVFTFAGISGAVFAAVAKSAGYTALCGFAKKTYDTTDNAAAARAVIRDFFAAVDENGAPLCKVRYINAKGTEIYTTYELKKLSFSNAVSILKSALDGLAAAAKNAAVKKNGNDNAAAKRNNVKLISRIISVHAAALDSTGRASLGARLDNNADAKIKESAAKIMNGPLPIGCVSVVTWNAAINGNEDAADAVEAAKNAATDAAAAQ